MRPCVARHLGPRRRSAARRCGGQPRWRILGSAWLLLLAIGLSPSAQAGALISIIIDDLGYAWTEGRAAIALPGAVACSFLPDAPRTRELAQIAHGAGKEVLVHLPLQPVAGPVHPLALAASQPAAQRHAQLERLLDAVPYAVGVNNHQGSSATASRSMMHWLMRELSLRRVGYFVDSMTSAQSIAYPMARAYGIAATRRRVFLDHERGFAAVRVQFQRLIAMAQKRGAALAIGHPHPETLAVLAEQLPHLAELGIELVPPSEFIARSESGVPLHPVHLRLSPSLDAPPPAPPRQTPPLPAAAAAGTQSRSPLSAR